ncbi:MAG: S8 family serine peptidase [Phycisphaeraceae bacterium]|nr:S8 family serine peptidase [Phycisphaeraceae bacterium]
MANGNSRVSACLRLMIAAGCAPFVLAGLCATPAGADEVVVQREIARAKPSVLSLRSGEVVLAQRENALLGAARPGRWWVIELDGPMTPARRLSLTESGLRIAGYLPTNAFIAEADLLDTPSLRALGFVRFAGEYDAAWRIDPKLRAQIIPPQDGVNMQAGAKYQGGGEEPAQGAAIPAAIWLFPGARGEATLEALARRAAVQLVSAEDVAGTWRLGITLPRDGAPDLDWLATLADVQYVEPVPEYTPRSNTKTRWVVQTNVLNQTPLYARGMTGAGQVIGVIDGWVSTQHCSFADTVPPGPTHRKILAYNTFESYDLHGTHVAATALGNNGTNDDTRGVAYGAKMVFNTWPSATEESVWSRFSLHASQGARVHTNSWGADWLDDYDGACRAIDAVQFIDDDNLIIFAVSNSSLIHNPENAKNSLAVSASRNNPQENQMCIGGAGPTLDGRRKPEVTAPGCSIFSASGATGCGVSGQSGTSMSAPAVAGLATLIRQYYLNGYYPSGLANPSDAFTPSGALLKATLVNSAQDMTDVAGYPNMREGWGRVLADATLFFAGDSRGLLVEDVRNASPSALQTGSVSTVRVLNLNASMPMRITMAYHDAPAAVNALLTPVNNLDLEVVSPSGQVFLGNVFAGGFSATGGTPDTLNNLEQVHIASPELGVWEVRIVAAAVNEGAQGFALVVSGDVAPAGCIGDFNGDGGVDGADVEAFFLAWEGGQAEADVNTDGGIDGEDVVTFFAAWEAGC